MKVFVILHTSIIKEISFWSRSHEIMTRMIMHWRKTKKWFTMKMFYENTCKSCYLNCQRNAFSILQNSNHNISTWMIISSGKKETKNFGNHLLRPHWLQNINTASSCYSNTKDLSLLVLKHQRCCQNIFISLFNIQFDEKGKKEYRS